MPRTIRTILAGWGFAIFIAVIPLQAANAQGCVNIGTCGLPLSMDLAIKNAFEANPDNACAFGPAEYQYTFAGRTIDMEGNVVSQAHSPLNCLACSIMANYSDSQLGQPGICDPITDANWNYATNCLAFGTNATLAVCAPPVYACRARGGQGNCINLLNGQRI